jgi:hypothetical protein
MVCFEVRVNGTLACTAGVGDVGVLSVIVTWVKRDRQVCPKDRDENEWSREDLGLSVSGLKGIYNHVGWLSQDLRSGDEVSIKVVEKARCDPPRSTCDPPRSKQRKQPKRHSRSD